MLPAVVLRTSERPAAIAPTLSPISNTVIEGALKVSVPEPAFSSAASVMLRGFALVNETSLPAPPSAIISSTERPIVDAIPPEPVIVSDFAVTFVVLPFPSVMAPPVAEIVTASPAAVTAPSAIFPELVIAISAPEPSALAEVRVRSAMVLSI